MFRGRTNFCLVLRSLYTHSVLPLHAEPAGVGDVYGITRAALKSRRSLLGGERFRY